MNKVSSLIFRTELIVNLPAFRPLKLPDNSAISELVWITIAA